jgi:hypothetical protein
VRLHYHNDAREIANCASGGTERLFERGADLQKSVGGLEGFLLNLTQSVAATPLARDSGNTVLLHAHVTED